MDCSVTKSKKYSDLFVISTTDFFYPLVEDPYQQGRIACCNVLSDMYAMGVVDIDNVLMLLASSSDMTVNDRNIISRLFIKGFDDQCKAADTQVSGGQTVVNPWPIIGGVAKSICKINDFIMPVNAVVGDVILLTKALGTQVAVNVKQWMRNEKRWSAVESVITKKEGNRAFSRACSSMCRLNKTSAILMHKYGAHAATDVTGFGILGHASNLASNQKEDVSFVIHTLPIIRTMPKINTIVNFKLTDGYSAETSGGLFICISKDNAELFCKEIKEIDGEEAWIIGDVVTGNKSASISPTVKIIEV